MIIRAFKGDKMGFYTGRAGEGFFSIERHEAYDGYNMEGAKRKAEQLNEMSAVHGVRFYVLNSDEPATAAAIHDKLRNAEGKL